MPGWIWRDTTQEQRDAALLEQTACGTTGPTSGLIGYVDGEAAGWVAVEPRENYPRLWSRKQAWMRMDPELEGVWSVTCFVVRKGQQNLDILLGNAPLTLLVPAALLFVIYMLARPTSWGSRAMQRSYAQAPTLRAGLIALLITLTIGFLINDSGVAIPAVGATLAVPLIVSVAMYDLLDEARAVAVTRSARRRR